MDNYYNNSNSYDDDDDPLYVLDDMDDDAGHVFSQLSAYAGPANSDLFFEFQNILMKKKEIQKKFYIKIEKKISEAWLYIGFLYSKGKNKCYFSNYKFCKLCFEKEDCDLKHFSLTTSTNTLKNHLIREHQIQFKRNEKISNQLSIRDIFHKRYFPKYVFARQVAIMCALDFEPFEIVERKGFRNLINSLGLNPKSMPSARTVADNGLNDIYFHCLKEVQLILENTPENIALMLDCWTDKYKKRPYITYRIQFVKDFKIHLVTLAMHLLERPHTGERIANDLKNVLSQFNLNNKVITAISDNGTNIKSALKKCNIKRLSCAAHNINLLINVDILQNEEFKVLREYVEKLRKTFQALSYKGDELYQIDITKNKEMIYNLLSQAEEIEENFSLEDQIIIGSEEDLSNYFKNISEAEKPTSLKLNNVTRWNSVLTMIDSFIKNYKNVNILLTTMDKTDLLIREMELVILKEFATFLKIFKECTTTLQGCKYSTSNLYLLFLIHIKKKINEYSEDACTGIMMKLYNKIDALLQKRYPLFDEHFVSSFLDVSQKNLTQLEGLLCNNLKKEEFLMKKITEHKIKINKESEIESTMSYQLKTSQRLSLVKDLEVENVRNEPLEEIKQYFDIQIDKDLEPLEWWEKNGPTFPHLMQLAVIYLGIPATSAGAEMAFSTAGNFLSAKRSLIHPSKLKKLCYINDNETLLFNFNKL